MSVLTEALQRLELLLAMDTAALKAARKESWQRTNEGGARARPRGVGA